MMKTSADDRSKIILKVIKLGVCGIFLAVFVHYTALFIFSVKYLEKSSYGKYFFTWMVNHGNKGMIYGRYRFVKENEHPDTPDRRKFYDFAQKGDAYLTRFSRPEHVPRGSGHHYSLNFDGYESYLGMRQRYIVETENLEDKLGISYEELMKEVKSRKEEDKSFFSDSPGKKMGDVFFSILFPPASRDEGWDTVTEEVCGTAFCILSKDDEYWFDGEKASPKLMERIRKGLSALKMEDISDDDINDLFKNLGKVSASPKQTFAYSRVAAIFYFITSGIEFSSERVKKFKDVFDEETSDRDLKEKRRQKYYEARMGYVYDICAKIVSMLYPVGDNENTGFVGKLRKFYSPSTAVNSDHDIDDEDIGSVHDALNTFVKSLSAELK